ncbi:NAD-dependent epimerase/dehydratase family protein [Vagococcus bubulae]|uniref:NAD-dependent epimerase n=1 Tax=Vagococcus bubulae TaxID=1977868 RepID=A0A429ZM58_9ENTE|nr:NAD-dependent epimerase/dehydratase family protein [Vagococcus bubulae]RST94785.1 NAD-dependent epimerase [Vagococcus bubulae]
MKRILVTGKTSYIGSSFVSHIEKNPEYQVDTISVRGDDWKTQDFSVYDVVLHCAGIAHADVGKVSKEEQQKYYDINCDLSYDIANKYKEDRKEKKSQFIYLSSIIVYGEAISIRKKRVITAKTLPTPSNFYGDSKWCAEKKLKTLETETFLLSIIRPPMVYGKGSKGNYPLLRKIALTLPVFPDIPNERSMIFIGNLNLFIEELIRETKTGIFFPQNNDYIRTSYMVKEIAKANGKNIKLFSFMNWSVYLLSYIPGKIGDLTNKAFGNLVYEKKNKTFYLNFEKTISETEKGG